jgi:hypothetical protein
MIESLEAKLEKNYGPIFHDHVGDVEMELVREGLESPMGNFTTDAYRHATHAEIGVDVINFIYGELHHGPARSVDVFNSNPGVYSPVTQKAWTVKLLPMKGRTLEWLLNFIFSVRNFGKMGLLCSSGLEIVFDSKARGSTEMVTRSLLAEFDRPTTLLAQFLRGLDEGNPLIKSITVQGEPLNPERTYQLAAGGGILEALKFINFLMPDTVPLDGLIDTQEESWRVMAEYLRAISPVTREKVSIGTRMQTVQSDLGVLYDDVSWEPLTGLGKTVTAKVRARVRNFGAGPASAVGQSIRLAINANGADYSVDAQWVEVGSPKTIRALGPQESQIFEWEVQIPRSRGTYSIAAQIQGNRGELNTSNDEVIRWFSPDKRTPPRRLWHR